jgi:sensor histidine kinase YesM
VGPLILLNLFLGILLENFDEGSLEMEMDKQIQIDKQRQIEYLKQ